MQLSDGTSEFFKDGTVYGWVHAFVATTGISTHYWSVANDQLPTGLVLSFKYTARNLAFDGNLAAFCAAAKVAIGPTAVCSRYEKT